MTKVRVRGHGLLTPGVLLPLQTQGPSQLGEMALQRKLPGPGSAVRRVGDEGEVAPLNSGLQT